MRSHSHFEFVLKQDDDTFVNLTYLRTWLHAQNDPHFIAGKLASRLRVVRSAKSRYFVPKSMWKHRHWPPMATGPAYVLSRSVVPQLLAAAHVSKTVVWLEDAYVTGVLRHKQKIRITSIPLLRHRRCSASNSTSRSFHRVTPHQHAELHTLGRCSDRAVDMLLYFQQPQ